MNQAKANQQTNLLLTGDKLKNHQSGTAKNPRSRYLEFVNAVMHAKQKVGFYLGVAFNHFKYTAAEQDARYFKLEKKVWAGTDYIEKYRDLDFETYQLFWEKLWKIQNGNEYFFRF